MGAFFGFDVHDLSSLILFLYQIFCIVEINTQSKLKQYLTRQQELFKQTNFSFNKLGHRVTIGTLRVINVYEGDLSIN